MIIKCTVEIGLVGCTREFMVEVNDEELEGLDEQARETVIWDEMVAEVWQRNIVNLSWEEVK